MKVIRAVNIMVCEEEFYERGGWLDVNWVMGGVDVWGVSISCLDYVFRVWLVRIMGDYDDILLYADFGLTMYVNSADIPGWLLIYRNGELSPKELFQDNTKTLSPLYI